MKNTGCKAPASADPPPAVLGVWLSPEEEVQWVWTHTPEGSYVSGYDIKIRNHTA